MFGGKREKALEEELEKVREQGERREEKFTWITEQLDDAMAQFSQMDALHDRLESGIGQAEENMRRIGELAEAGTEAAESVHLALVETNNGVGTFDVNHSVFLDQIKKQHSRVMEIVDNNKHFTTPMKYISEAPASMKEDMKEMESHVLRMKEFSKSMTVLSLNAAIEAGRMGEPGEKFVASAEKISSYSEDYEREAGLLEEKMQEFDARWEELEEQIRHLNKLLKENNISMHKLLQEGMQGMAAYEGSQLDLRELISDTAVGRADALTQAGAELSKVGKRLEMEMEDIRGAIEEQQKCADKLEDFCVELERL